ncbi:hypothetical protein [Nonomuraea sp. NPDC049400]|uniref:hypothetical protein n=1 Tax=Nonomuraea sp. NPDC049400 TaxID=3364352 RepID=UPI00379F48C7
MTSSSLSEEDLRPRIREALALLLDAMRPDWGGADAIAGRIRFAEDRLQLTLPDICVQAVRAAAIPTMAPDSFIRQNPDRRADAAHMQRSIAELRRRLARPMPSSTEAETAPASQATEQVADDATVAAERAWLVQAVAPAYRREKASRAAFEQRHSAVRPAFEGLLPEE